MLRQHEQVSFKWCKAFNAPVYQARIHSIEASRMYLQGAAPP
jgi:hypothetical protein